MPNPSVTSSKSLYDYTCVRLDALYVKQSNSIQPELIMHCISYSIPHSPHIKCTQCTHTHTQKKHSCFPLSPSLFAAPPQKSPVSQ